MGETMTVGVFGMGLCCNEDFLQQHGLDGTEAVVLEREHRETVSALLASAKAAEARIAELEAALAAKENA